MQELALTPRARLVLVRMCVSAKDADRPPIYYGGWPHLAEPLGFASYTGAAHTAVTRAVRELSTAGLIKAHGAPGPRHNVTYELRL